MLIESPRTQRIVFPFVMVLHDDVDALVLAGGNQPVRAIETISHQCIAWLELIEHLPQQSRLATLFTGVGAEHHIKQ